MLQTFATVKTPASPFPGGWLEMEHLSLHPHPPNCCTRQVFAVLLLKSVLILPPPLCLGQPTTALGSISCNACYCAAYELRMVFKCLNSWQGKKGAIQITCLLHESQILMSINCVGTQPHIPFAYGLWLFLHFEDGCVVVTQALLAQKPEGFTIWPSL